ncbi:type V CRISPR-associated protein Cas4 [Candidatus Haliotispira prima]|uniref:Type V CRISPR-associated protein Cas4 n=1 Tax=Candidatus Haliotispira prima TaxID=3034016 RepID=A0ABY8MDZ3_9SPIO|nr:type V CRISPR-associated protein Cas4 [Candidatus Haliotispira prima]
MERSGQSALVKRSLKVQSRKMEQGYLSISWLNDYLFCPYSIYLHNIYADFSRDLYQDKPQRAGTIAHDSIDQQRYSTRKDELSGISVISTEFMLQGKIDLYKGRSRELIERKKKIRVVYDGYVYQLLAQYFCMVEMGYAVDKLSLYSMDDNKKYSIDLPDTARRADFAAHAERVRTYQPDMPLTHVNARKCQSCIYHELCEKREF